MAAAGGGGGGLFPEESFRSWSAYGRALLETGPRLRDRATARSLDSAEVNEVRGRSGAEMKRTLTWWDLIWFGIGAVIGAGIFVLTGQEASDAAGPAAAVSCVSDSPPCSPTWALHLLPCSSTSVAAVEKGIYGPYFYWLLWIHTSSIPSIPAPPPE